MEEERLLYPAKGFYANMTHRPPSGLWKRCDRKYKKSGVYYDQREHVEYASTSDFLGVMIFGYTGAILPTLLRKDNRVYCQREHGP